MRPQFIKGRLKRAMNHKLCKRRRRTFCLLPITLSVVLFCGFLCQKVAAQTGNPQITVFNNFLNTAAQTFLPKTFPLVQPNATPGSGPSELTLVDIRYCGAEMPDRARLIGIAYPGPAPAQRPTPVLMTNDDCQLSLASLAQRAAAGTASPEWVIALTISVTFRRFELRFAVGDVNTAVRAGTTTQPPSNLRTTLQNNGQPFAIVPTSAVRLTLEGQVEEFSLATRFTGMDASVMLVPASQAASFTSAMLATQDPNMSGVGAPELTNLILKLPHTFTSNLLNTHFRETVFPLERSASGDPTLTVRNLGLIGAAGRFTLAGRLREVPNNIEVNARVEWSGSDLRLSSIQLEAIVEDCNALPIVQRAACNVRNSARRAGATALASALTARFRDRPLKPVGPRSAVPFDIGGRQYNLRASVLRTHSTADSFYLFGNVLVEGR
jgi:hypothetical protein